MRTLRVTLLIFIYKKAMATHSSTFAWKKSHGWRSLVGCSPWGCEESDTTEQLRFHFSLSCLEKEMATHSSVLAWRIPGTGKPGGLLSMGSHGVGHDWSDLAAAQHIAVLIMLIMWYITALVPICLTTGSLYLLITLSNWLSPNSLLLGHEFVSLDFFFHIIDLQT